jgi:hypothetical protein
MKLRPFASDELRALPHTSLKSEQVSMLVQFHLYLSTLPPIRVETLEKKFLVLKLYFLHVFSTFSSYTGSLYIFLVVNS